MCWCWVYTLSQAQYVFIGKCIYFPCDFLSIWDVGKLTGQKFLSCIIFQAGSVEAGFQFYYPTSHFRWIQSPRYYEHCATRKLELAAHVFFQYPISSRAKPPVIHHSFFSYQWEIQHLGSLRELSIRWDVVLQETPVSRWEWDCRQQSSPLRLLWHFSFSQKYLSFWGGSINKKVINNLRGKAATVN